MNGSCLNFDSPIRDAISRIRFAPLSNNLLISSWDSRLRLFDVDRCELTFASEATNGASALIDCCFESETVALSANSDGSILRYDLHVGNSKAIGNHDDLASCIEYSKETRQIISASWDKRVNFWDPRSTTSYGCLSSLGMEVESMSLAGLNLLVAHNSSVHLYDLRYLDRPVQLEEKSLVQIKCVRSNSARGGFIAGSTDGRVALRNVGQSNTNEGYAFRCHPKNKDGNQHLVAINDIAFRPSQQGIVVVGDNDGYVTMWDVLKRRWLFEFPRFPNSVASLACNYGGQLLAVASSYTYQEANEREEQPLIFLQHIGSISASSSRS